jgi:hypothetical protein
MSHFRAEPPQFLQEDASCWAHALASFNTVSLGQLCFPEELLVTYRPFTVDGGGLKPGYWPNVADAEQISYFYASGSDVSVKRIGDLLQASHLYVAEDKKGSWSHSYVVYGVRSGNYPLLAVMNPQVLGLSWRSFDEIAHSKLMIGYRGIPDA